MVSRALDNGAMEDYRCETCGEEVTIFRRRKDRRPRPIGHRKHLWCYECDGWVAHRKVGDEDR